MCSHLLSLLAVPFYVAPNDYTAVSSQPVTFSSGPDQMCIPISISDDEVVEETESFAVTLVSGDPVVQLTLSNASVIIIDRSSKCTPSVSSVRRQKINVYTIASVAVVHTVCSWTQRALDYM